MLVYRCLPYNLDGPDSKTGPKITDPVNLLWLLKAFLDAFSG